jgi:predicted TIM-barrel fold metal-dependent hydrolase
MADIEAIRALLFRACLANDERDGDMYGSLWFEAKTLPLLELYPDNHMFETDYPHPTSLAPGPASYAAKPADHIRAHWQDLPLEVARKVLHGNAARVYRWDA